MQSNPGTRKSQTILVVDDEPMTRSILRALLEEAGARVVEARSGAEALTQAETARPDLILLDVMMPVLDGFETCRKLRLLPGGDAVPIMMMTGSNDVATVSRAYEAGATDFEVKTVSPVVLWQRIRYLLRAKGAFDELRESENRLATAERIARAGSWEWHPATGIHRWSRGLFRLFELDPGQAQPSHDLFLAGFHEDERGPLGEALAEAFTSHESYAGEHRILRPDGGSLVCRLHADVVGEAGSEDRHLTGLLQDVSDLRTAQDQLRALAFYDQCTGLPNRNLLRQQVERMIDEARRSGQLVAILFMDLDNFKRVNDTLGHSAGDELLATVGTRLKEAVRTNDLCGWNDGSSGSVLARHGGDEFIVCLHGIRQPEDASRVANRILKALTKPIPVAGRELVMTASIGISLFPQDGTSPEEILKHADAAMYDAKNSGRNTFRFFDEQLSARAFNRLAMEATLRNAVVDQQFTLDYQPLVDATTGRIIGAESLIRWNHPELGLIAPTDFIPLAEETGMILDVGAWVLRESCLQAAAWRAKGHLLEISVNVSGRQFWHPEIVELVGRTLAETGLEPSALAIEITEGVLVQSTADALRTLSRLKDLGIRIALDDFGTGHSSLQYLRRFPVDVLKLDQVFVREVEWSDGDAALTAAIAAMARSMGIEPLAEGIERVAQRDRLLAQGYRLMQGYYFGQPMPLGEFLKAAVNGVGATPTLSAVPTTGLELRPPKSTAR